MHRDQFVPKVHPLTREVVPDDPLELMAQTVVGDPDVMLECILQEFVWMGWSEEQLLSLFHHPGYQVLCQLREFYGDAEVARRVWEIKKENLEHFPVIFYFDEKYKFLGLTILK